MGFALYATAGDCLMNRFVRERRAFIESHLDIGEL